MFTSPRWASSKRGLCRCCHSITLEFLLLSVRNGHATALFPLGSRRKCSVRPEVLLRTQDHVGFERKYQNSCRVTCAAPFRLFGSAEALDQFAVHALRGKSQGADPTVTPERKCRYKNTGNRPLYGAYRAHNRIYSPHQHVQSGLWNARISPYRGRTLRLYAVWPEGSDSEPEVEDFSPAEVVDAVVVGAGIAGLTAAKRLQMAGTHPAPLNLVSPSNMKHAIQTSSMKTTDMHRVVL